MKDRTKVVFYGIEGLIYYARESMTILCNRKFNLELNIREMTKPCKMNDKYLNESELKKHELNLSNYYKEIESIIEEIKYIENILKLYDYGRALIQQTKCNCRVKTIYCDRNESSISKTLIRM